MKRIFSFVLLLICIRSAGQQIPSQIQAKRGVFTESLFLKDRLIDHISTDINADSTNDNALATGNAVRLATNNYIKNQLSAAQPASFNLQGLTVVGSHNSFKNTLSSGYPANVNVTHGGSQYGLSIQRSSNDQSPANLVLFKNNATDFNSLNALQFGGYIGSINFSGIAGDNSTVSNPTSIYGFVEKTAPAFLSSGFIFNTTDSNGVNARRMGINAQGNLMIGNATINPYKLNVTNGDVRFGLLADAEWGEVLAGVDNDGKIKKILPGNVYPWEGILYAEQSGSSRNYERYLATLTQSGTNDPVVTVLENTMGLELDWVRDSTGNYKAFAEYRFWEGTLLHSYPADPSGNVLSSRLYRKDGSTLILVVKDSAMASKDGWSQITIEVIQYILG